MKLIKRISYFAVTLVFTMLLICTVLPTAVSATAGSLGTLTVTTTTGKTNAGVSTPPTVTTGNANSITATGATLNGSYVIGSMPITYKGFELKHSSAISYTTYYADYSSGSNFSATITNLASGTYKCRAFVITDGGTYYGEDITFTTFTAPTVSTGNANSITENGATLIGSYVIGSMPITYKGFELKLSGDLSYTTYYADQSSGANFSATITNLPSGTYNYRSFVTTADDTYYGEDITFTISVNNVPNTGDFDTYYTYALLIACGLIAALTAMKRNPKAKL